MIKRLESIEIGSADTNLEELAEAGSNRVHSTFSATLPLQCSCCDRLLREAGSAR